MTDTREQNHAMARDRPGVSSSARDPIDRWLGVFVRLLRVPRADAKRIRDELEDHLRARVDDLMLTGHAEPEAVRIAVAELGETAELARQFQTAAKPHRRTAMLAASAVLSAGLITGAVLITQTPTPPTPTTPDGIAAQQAAAIDAQPTFAADLNPRPESDYATLGDALDAIAETLGTRVLPHERALVAQLAETGEGGEGLADEFAPIPWAGLTVDQGLMLLAQRLRFAESDPLVLQPGNGIVELAPRSLFDRRDAELRDYDMREFGLDGDPYQLMGAVVAVIEPQLWSRPRGGEHVAAAEVVNDTLIVTAPPRIHDQIRELLLRMKDRAEQQRQAELEARRQLEFSVAKLRPEQQAREEAALTAYADTLRREGLRIAEELAVKRIEFDDTSSELADFEGEDWDKLRAMRIRLDILGSEVQQLEAMLAGIHASATKERAAVARAAADRAAAAARLAHRESQSEAETD